MVSFIEWLSGIVWNQFFIYGFLLVGLFFTIITRFVQMTEIKDMFKLTLNRETSDSGVSSFQAISMSLGSRLGTGNIAGVATAIALGGPGAVFWMWVMAFLGAATSFIETTLSQVFKSKMNGEYRGGAPFYIEKGLGFTKLAILFAILTIIGKGFMLMNIQSNTVSVAMEGAFGMHPGWVGLALVVLFALIVFGGVKRIAKVSELAVPFLAIGYLAITAMVLLANASLIPDVFQLIVSSALGAEATFGGIIGSAIAWGVQRGFFSNAAGAGSETFEGGAAEVSHPAKQGFVQSLAVYIDTWIICSATAFMILITGMFNVEGSGVVNIPGVEAGATNVQMAVDTIMPGFGYPFLAIALFFFCFTTMISYYYKAETSLAFINSKMEVKSLWTDYTVKAGMLIFIFVGSIIETATAWTLGDIALGSMAYVNVFSILLLTRVALVVLKDYREQRSLGIDPVFDPVKLGIKNADFWEKEYGKQEKDEREEQIERKESKVV